MIPNTFQDTAASSFNALPSDIKQQTNALPSDIKQQTNALPSDIKQQTNALPSDIKQLTNFNKFCTDVKTFLMNKAKDSQN